MKQRDELLVLTMAGSLWPTLAVAEEAAKPSAGYGGTDYIWFTVIAVVLLYGIYDTFLKPS
jgi:hypothetical protein